MARALLRLTAGLACTHQGQCQASSRPDRAGCVQVVASTAVLMILFSSSSIAISLSFEHLLNTSYALVYAPVAFAGSLVGVVVLGRLVQATGRPSITIWILTALILVGTLLTAGLGSARAWEDVEHGGRAAFKSFCAA